MTTPTTGADFEQRLAEASSRFTARIATALATQAAALPHDIGERLRVSRERALQAATQARRQERSATAAVVAGRSGRTATLSAPSPRWLKIASGVPVLLLLLGLFAIDWFTSLEDVATAAEIDALLLADELPPQAYTDPGFAEFLKLPRQEP